MNIFIYESPFGKEWNIEGTIKEDHTFNIMLENNIPSKQGFIISENGNEYQYNEISIPQPIIFALRKGKSVNFDGDLKNFLVLNELTSYILVEDLDFIICDFYGIQVQLTKQEMLIISEVLV